MKLRYLSFCFFLWLLCLCLFVACGQKDTLLQWQEQPFSCTVAYTEYDAQGIQTSAFSAEVCVRKNGGRTLTYLSPDAMQGICVRYEGGAYTLSYDGMILPAGDKAETMFAVLSMLTEPAKSTPVKTGENTWAYQTEDANVSLQIGQNGAPIALTRRLPNGQSNHLVLSDWERLS